MTLTLSRPVLLSSMLHCSAFLLDGARALTTFNFSCPSVLHHYLRLHACSSVEDTKSIKLIWMRKAPEPTKKDRLSILLGDIQIHTEHLGICSQSSACLFCFTWCCMTGVYLDCSQCLVLTNTGADILHTHLCYRYFHQVNVQTQPLLYQKL